MCRRTSTRHFPQNYKFGCCQCQGPILLTIASLKLLGLTARIIHTSLFLSCKEAPERLELIIEDHDSGNQASSMRRSRSSGGAAPNEPKRTCCAHRSESGNQTSYVPPGITFANGIDGADVSTLGRRMNKITSADMKKTYGKGYAMLVNFFPDAFSPVNFLPPVFGGSTLSVGVMPTHASLDAHAEAHERAAQSITGAELDNQWCSCMPPPCLGGI